MNRKEAEIVSLTFDLYLMNVGSSRIGELLDYLGVETGDGNNMGERDHQWDALQ